MKLKVTGVNGFNKVISIESDAVLKEFVAAIAHPEEIIAIRFGYPPTKLGIDETNIDTKLDDLNISSGEKISITIANENSGSINHTVPVEDNKGSARILKETQLYLALPDGQEEILQTHVVPDDNSCLFHAISYCIYKETSLSEELRNIVSLEILSKPNIYSEVILERSNQDYAKWITKKDSWGGAIEIGILSEKMSTATYVIDIDAEKIEKFNEDKFDNFIMIMFNGIHYDSVELANGKTVFNKQDSLMSNLVLSGALGISKQMKSTGYSFNTRRDKIICNVCKNILTGEREVAKHAESTGHVDFGQA